MNALLYTPIYLTIIGVLSLAMGLKLIATDGDTLAIGEGNKGNFILPFAISVFFAVWMGIRPISFVFGDTGAYAHSYNLINVHTLPSLMLNTEWLWDFISFLCKKYGLTIHQYFLVIEIGYVFSAFWAVKKFVPTSPYLGILFVFSSLMFFTFGVNGLRNGLACHIVMLAMAFFMEEKRIIAFVLAFLALGIHRSVMLPIVSVIASITVIREPKIALYIWLSSILISLFFGKEITSLISSLGFDERMTHYTTSHEYDNQFSSTGFRWDFILFSAMPIAMIYYVNIRKDLHDGWYNILATTYLLSNAFWIIVIRTSFTNRFAYLSWFLMPILLVYPLCNMKAWENQDRVAGQILIAYTAFTIFMMTFFWSYK